MMARIRDYVNVRARFMPHRPGAGVRRDAYDALVDGLLEYRTSIRMPYGATIDDLKGLTDLVKLDFPELFYVGSGSVTMACLGSCSVSLAYAPRYRLGEKDVLSTLDAMVKAADEALRALVAPRREALSGESARRDQLGDLDALHDWLVRRYAYADGERSYAHEAPGPLVYGVGVCEGVAKAFKYLCDRLGITCCVVTGEARDTGRRGAGYEPHVWNLVRVPVYTERRCRNQPPPYADDEWTNVDVTFDAALSHDIIRHDYFGRTDAELASSHRRGEPDPLPAGGGSLRYYERNGLVATSASCLAQIVDHDLPRRGGTEFSMPRIWDGRAQADDAVGKGLSRSAALGCEGRAYAIYPNHDLMVFGVEALS